MKAPHEPTLHSGRSALSRVFGQSRNELDRAWEGFHAGAARETLLARSPILDSWERCRASRVNLETAYAPQMGRDTLEARRREHRPLLRASAETLADAADILIGTDTIMLVTDPRGLVLEGVGDSSALRAGTDIALGRGGDWREGAAGTNGIGVALATAQPMLVHAGEHYCERMKSWSCAAAPVIDPCDGTVAGILNLSARSHVANSQIFALAVLGARRIEQALLHQADLFRARLLELALEQGRRYRWDGLIAIDAKGRLAYASHQATRLLRDRLGVRLPGTTPGQRAFAIDGAFATTGQDMIRLPGLPDVPADWIKPIRVDGEIGGYMMVIPAEDRAAGKRRAAAPRKQGDEGDPARSDFSAIVGDSPALHAAIARAKRLAPSHLPLLIEGETGVGKELFARAIHGHGETADGPFVTFNCGAVSRELIASELFGYAKGAFTGASLEGRPGRFELADGGTLCLDEIGELALDLQPYLLRVLEEGVVSRIGEGQVRRVKVRVIAMTNRDLRAEVAAGRFRRDLYHRLAVATVAVPPLRDRDGDLEELLAHFGTEIALRTGDVPVRFTDAALARLESHDWPGNVRELRNLLETATLLARDGVADVDALPEALAEVLAADGALPGGGGSIPLAAVEDERTRIVEAIGMTAGNMSVACTILGISRSTLYRRMEHYGLDRSRLRSSHVERLRPMRRQ
jgi:sigma-54 dependent transcriptional regulator, acetoin dehydrogenase operon transcriptional activator AcoR